MLQCAPLFQSTFALMPNNPAIDTTVLITILGLIAAVWAVVPTSTRLRFRLGMSWVDWCVAIGVFLVVHYLVFEAFFRSVGLYYSFGPWKWGLDKGSSVYLLLLGLGLYILLRARKPKLASRKIRTFEKLVNTLLLTKRYDELYSLIEPHLYKLFRLTKHRPILVRLISKFTPKPLMQKMYWKNGSFVTQPVHEGNVKKKYRSIITKIASRMVARNSLANRARDILKILLNQPQFVTYLSVCHPHFSLKILGVREVVREDFIELFVTALMSDSNSLLYSELKNNENLNGRHRLALPRSNRIIYFLFKDVRTAERLGFYQPVGGCVCRHLDENHKLIEAHNLPLGYYDQLGRYRCPVYAGIKLFEIMIHEAIHQGVQDHLSLFYFTHFIGKILKQLREQQPEDSNVEWPTPFHYLIYQIVTITTHWVVDCIEVDYSKLPEPIISAPDFDPHYIPKHAAEALGNITQKILLSPKIGDRFKGYVLEISLEGFNRIQRDEGASSVAQAFISSMLCGGGYVKDGYIKELYRVYKRLDHALRYKVSDFGLALEAAQK
jgi:hypothetical protein